MKPTETGSYSIDRVGQVRALAAPARQEILDALQVAGPTTDAGAVTALYVVDDDGDRYAPVLRTSE